MISPKIKLWIVPAIIFISLVIVAIRTTVFQMQTERHHQEEKSLQIANAISKNMSREVEYRLQALKIFSSTIHKPPTNREFEAAAGFLRSEYSGFFAINFINADGIITKVFPYEENKAAEGQNLMIRNDVNNYLLDSKADGQPRVSHRILTYQNIYAVVLYVPLHDKEGKFFGWTNGVLYLDRCLIDYMKDKNLENVIARVRWHHPAETNVLEYNWNFPVKFHTSTYKIMNQTVSIDIALLESPVDHKRKQSFYMTILLRTGLIFLVTILVVLLTLSKEKLQKINEQLSLKNSLLSALSHDLATPLTTLKIMLELSVHKGELVDTKKDIYASVSSMEQMMKSVRVLHSYENGIKNLPLEVVSLRSAVTDALKLVEQLAVVKKVRFEISPPLQSDLSVKADAHTVVYNVLLNVFTNAIKFSPPESVITIGHEFGKGIGLTVTNPGQGLAAVEIEQFNKLQRIDTKIGTGGEPGSGLGLIQISGFMKMYNGEFSIENSYPGTKVTLRFKNA